MPPPPPHAGIHTPCPVHAGIHTPLGRHPLPPTATAADGTHPTGMHSCWVLVLLLPKTSMHFSRPRTACLLTISCSIPDADPAPDADSPGCTPPSGCRPPLFMWPVMHAGKPPPPLWTERMTHACENITFPQLLLRAVKISEWYLY